MTKKSKSSRPLGGTSFRTGAVCGALLWLAGCGGGGDLSAAMPSQTPLSSLVYTQGTVEGLGSVVVNGVHFDDTTAKVTDELGTALQPVDLKLGMRVEVLAPPATTSADGVARATAQSVRYVSEVQGPISGLLPSGFVVLGHTVNHDARTVFDDGRASTLRVGQMVEVHGLRDTQGVIQASLIDIESDRDEQPKVIGTLTAFNSAKRTAELDGVPFTYADLPIPPDPTLGQRVRVELAPSAGDPQWTATQWRVLDSLGERTADRSVVPREAAYLDIEGLVSRVDAPTRFVVAGVTVDTSQAQVLALPLTVGEVVEVEGTWSNGTLLARRIERERHLDSDEEGFEIEGVITAVDPAIEKLVVRGITVDWRRARFEDGSAQQLAVGRRVDVKGPLSADGNSVQATEIEFD